MFVYSSWSLRHRRCSSLSIRQNHELLTYIEFCFTILQSVVCISVCSFFPDWLCYCISATDIEFLWPIFDSVFADNNPSGLLITTVTSTDRKNVDALPLSRTDAAYFDFMDNGDMSQL